MNGISSVSNASSYQALQNSQAAAKQQSEQQVEATQTRTQQRLRRRDGSGPNCSQNQQLGTNIDYLA